MTASSSDFISKTGSKKVEIITNAVSLFNEHWTKKKVKCDSLKDKNNYDEVEKMATSLGISKNSLHQCAKNENAVEEIKSRIESMFKNECTKMLDVLEKGVKGELPLSTMTNFSEQSAMECLAIALAQHKNFDLAHHCQDFINNMKTLKKSFNGNGYVDVLVHIGNNPHTKRQSQKIRAPIEKLLDELMALDNETKRDFFVESFMVFTKLIERCLENYLNKKEWTYGLGPHQKNGYDNAVVKDAYEMIKKAYKECKDVRGMNHEIFYASLQRRMKLINVWIPLYIRQQKRTS